MPVSLTIVAVAIGLVLLGLAVCTAQGARRRGTRAVGAALSGFFFPVAWVRWYVQDGALGARQRGTRRTVG